VGTAGHSLKCAAGFLAFALWLFTPGSAGAVQPSEKYATEPGSLGLIFENVHFPSLRDSVPVQGWWFPAAVPGPVVVIFPRGRGNMADLLPCVLEFARRGFAVLTFDPRDFGPGGAGDADSLREVIFASRWVDDAEAAVRFARTRAAGQPVFAWGQDLGASLAVAVAGRQRGVIDGIAIEGVFRTTTEQLDWLGLSQEPSRVRRHRVLVDQRDEPISAASRARVPILAVLAGKDEVTPPQTTELILAANGTSITKWLLPAAAHDGAERTPGYFDRITEWLRLRARVTPVRPY
jgi:dienelactone hydrolase